MAAPTPLAILFLVFLLETKHFICDGPLQTKQMIAAKAIYGNPLGILHGSIHGAASFAVLEFWGIPWWLAGILALAEAALHYHIDFLKENFVKRAGWTVRDPHFWWVLTGDQALHHFSYLAMAAAVVLSS